MGEQRTFSEDDITLLLKAMKFAAEKHRKQKRKDREKSPYINHPIEVAESLWSVGKLHDINAVCSALLHDTVEDTDASFEELEEMFGEDITSLVREVTDDKSLPKERRKELQIEHGPHLTARAKYIKLCDKSSNINDIRKSPPADWSIERLKEYLTWTKKCVDTMRGTNKELEERYDSLLEQARETVEKVADER